MSLVFILRWKCLSCAVSLEDHLFIFGFTALHVRALFQLSPKSIPEFNPTHWYEQLFFLCFQDFAVKSYYIPSEHNAPLFLKRVFGYCTMAILLAALCRNPLYQKANTLDWQNNGLVCLQKPTLCRFVVGKMVGHWPSMPCVVVAHLSLMISPGEPGESQPGIQSVWWDEMC